MKKLILVRHAKSDWPEDTEDFDRPLSECGVRDAEKMSKLLKEHQVDIQRFITSPAVRALKTCEIFNQNYQIEYCTDDKLYNPSEDHFHAVIYNLEDQIDTVAMFSHNNGLSNFANSFSFSDNIFHFPTCGIAGFEIQCSSWSEFEGAKKKLLFFYDPKNI